MPNTDPTKTTTLRRAFMVDMRKRFRLLMQDITELLVELDALGLQTSDFVVQQVGVDRQAWRFQTDDAKLASFQRWFKARVDQRVFTVTPTTGQPWTAEYVEDAYRMGMRRSYMQSKKAFPDEVPFTTQTQEEFLRSAFAQPETVSKVRLLSTRTFEQLNGVTATMGQRMSRVLSDGLVRGANPREIARDMRRGIRSLTRTRALTIARTEIIHTHAEGQLDSFERLGVKELKIMAEWLTAGDNRVCPQCAIMEGAVITVEKARGLIPRHPNCRCAWTPAKRDRKAKGQKRGTAADRAIQRSIRRERKTGTFRQAKRQSRWLGKELIS